MLDGSFALGVMRRLWKPTSHPLKDGPNADSILWINQMDSIEADTNSLLHDTLTNYDSLRPVH